jgi:predicted membrane protein
MHLPSLLVALAIMLAGSIYPIALARANGSVDHGFLLALLLAMSAGLVRGVGFVPHALGWRLLFSGWSCLAALLLAVGLRWIA